jgi:hypothetical protein
VSTRSCGGSFGIAAERNLDVRPRLDDTVMNFRISQIDGLGPSYWFSSDSFN